MAVKRKGEVAKDEVLEILKKAFGNKFVGVQDKKVYLNMEEDGEIVQFALSITKPKTMVTIEKEESKLPQKEESKIIDISSKERDRKIQEESVRKLKERLGL